MAKYVDLSSVIEGDGSELSPWCGSQVGTYPGLLKDITEEIKIKGQATLDYFVVGVGGATRT